MSKEEAKKEKKDEAPKLSKDEIINAVIRDCVDISIAALNAIDNASFQYDNLEDAVILKTMAQGALDKYTRPKAKEENENAENASSSVD